MKKKLLLLGFSFFTGILSAQLNPTVSAGLDNILISNSASYGLEGVEATIISPDGCIWNAGAGIAGPSTPVSSDKAWHWGSVTKSMTASIILQLADEGLLDLQDPIGMYLDVDTIPYLDSLTTIHSLLNQTTNLSNMWEDGLPLWNAVWSDRDSVWNIWDVLDYRAPGISNPDMIHNYVALDNYLILGFLVEAIEGDLLENVFESRLFLPLNMDHSFCGTNGIMMSSINGVYNGSEYRGNWPHNSYISTRGGAGTYLGSSLDAAKFMRAFHNADIVSSSKIALTHIPANGDPTALPSNCLGDGEQTYGYGTNIVQFVTPSDDTLLFYGHGGNGLGNALAFHNPELNFTITLITNDLSMGAQLNNFYLFMDLVCYAFDNWSDMSCSLGIDETQETSFQIYPNPGGNFLMLESEIAPNEILIYDMSGRQVLQVFDTAIINVEHLRSGTYFVYLNGQNKSIVKKWVKE